MLFQKYPIASVWLQCRSLTESILFYRDILQLPLIEATDYSAHFDGGGMRLSLHPDGDEFPIPCGSFVVFFVPQAIEEVYEELVSRGIEFRLPLAERPYGRSATFDDPDGHTLIIWQPPKLTDERFPRVRSIVEHYDAVLQQSVSARYPDCRESGQS